MNIRDAFDLIGVPESASEDILKARYKELAKKYHPDVYKEDPDKFKKINEAYQAIQDYKTNGPRVQPNAGPNPGVRYHHINIEDVLHNLNNDYGEGSSKRYSGPPPQIQVKITFKDSILGCDREIKYKRVIKCGTCNGNGLEYINNGCTSCNGFGRVVTNANGMMYTKVCIKCYGKNIKRNKCIQCKSEGIIENEITGSVHIPPGITNGATLRLQGMGNYGGNAFFGDTYSDAFVHVAVELDKKLTLIGNDVVASLDISLLEALQGCKKEVETIFDKKEITVSALSKNKDEIKIPGCGVKGTGGVHKIILNVQYPKDLSILINALQETN